MVDKTRKGPSPLETFYIDYLHVWQFICTVEHKIAAYKPFESKLVLTLLKLKNSLYSPNESILELDSWLGVNKHPHQMGDVQEIRSKIIK